MKEISKFYKSLVQEVVIRQRANEEGDSQEQTFTRYCMELLSEAGETENYDIAFLERGLGTKNQLKINGYAISDNYETVDLFISLYEGSEEPTTIHKVKRNSKERLMNFLIQHLPKHSYLSLVYPPPGYLSMELNGQFLFTLWTVD